VSKLDITIEQMYQEFLKGIKLPENRMHPIQKKQVKEAFMGGLSTFMKIFMVDFNKHTDKECEDFLTSIEEQLKDYWKGIISESLPKN
jgi:hypothetical protein